MDINGGSHLWLLVMDACCFFCDMKQWSFTKLSCKSDELPKFFVHKDKEFDNDDEIAEAFMVQ